MAQACAPRAEAYVRPPPGRARPPARHHPSSRRDRRPPRRRHRCRRRSDRQCRLPGRCNYGHSRRCCRSGRRSPDYGRRSRGQAPADGRRDPLELRAAPLPAHHLPSRSQPLAAAWAAGADAMSEVRGRHQAEEARARRHSRGGEQPPRSSAGPRSRHSPRTRPPFARHPHCHRRHAPPRPVPRRPLLRTRPAARHQALQASAADAQAPSARPSPPRRLLRAAVPSANRLRPRTRWLCRPNRHPLHSRRSAQQAGRAAVARMEEAGLPRVAGLRLRAERRPRPSGERRARPAPVASHCR